MIVVQILIVWVALGVAVVIGLNVAKRWYQR